MSSFHDLIKDPNAEELLAKVPSNGDENASIAGVSSTRLINAEIRDRHNTVNVRQQPGPRHQEPP